MHTPVVAIYDANILYPAPLRDLFIRLAHRGLVRARWTRTIHDEWMQSLLRDQPRLSAERLARTRDLMDEAVRDCLITGYEHLIESLVLPDVNDRHVLAAAIYGGASVIVTRNLRDFPAKALAEFNIEAAHPDAFLIALLASSPEAVFAILKHQRESLRNPPMSVDDFLVVLELQGLASAVAHLRLHRELL